MSKTLDKVHNIARGDVMPKIFNVVIHPCEDTGGYWAECICLPGCFTDGTTLHETQINMFESVNLFIKDDYPDVNEYYLNFKLQGVKDA
ncbi:MAG: type II toxin-antitoxin system HicB family antitoxin [Defluviitaleaceae bacterium]|nr:type II toxin-antitoxin system HicB family antitoxin [Defluviitaleaceae bacterium]